jgi:hypothetical protein
MTAVIAARAFTRMFEPDLDVTIVGNEAGISSSRIRGVRLRRLLCDLQAEALEPVLARDAGLHFASRRTPRPRRTPRSRVDQGPMGSREDVD